MKYAKKKCENESYYANICKYEYEKKWQGCGARLCLRLVLNKLKEMKGFIYIYTLLGP
jgi:hypothetical protein